MFCYGHTKKEENDFPTRCTKLYLIWGKGKEDKMNATLLHAPKDVIHMPLVPQLLELSITQPHLSLLLHYFFSSQKIN